MASSSHAAIDDEVVMCASSDEDAQLLCAMNAPGIQSGGVLKQSAGVTMQTKKHRRSGRLQKQLKEETLKIKIAAVCEVQSAFSLGSMDDGSLILNKDNRFLQVHIGCIGKPKRLDKVSEWASNIGMWRSMAVDTKIIRKYCRDPLSVLTRVPHWWLASQKGPSAPDALCETIQDSDEEEGLEHWISSQKQITTGRNIYLIKYPGLEKVIRRFHAVHEQTRVADEPCDFSDGCYFQRHAERRARFADCSRHCARRPRGC